MVCHLPSAIGDDMWSAVVVRRREFSRNLRLRRDFGVRVRMMVASIVDLVATELVEVEGGLFAWDWEEDNVVRVKGGSRSGWVGVREI